MEPKELIKEFKEKFEELKQKHQIKTTYEELDKSFRITNSLLHAGYVPNYLLTIISRLILDSLMWNSNYLHSLIVPQPSSIYSMTESSAFNDEDKPELQKMLHSVMQFSSRLYLINTEEDENKYALYIDDAIEFSKNELEPKMKKIFTKINTKWKEEKVAEHSKPQYD